MFSTQRGCGRAGTQPARSALRIQILSVPCDVDGAEVNQHIRTGSNASQEALHGVGVSCVEPPGRAGPHRSV